VIRPAAAPGNDECDMVTVQAPRQATVAVVDDDESMRHTSACLIDSSSGHPVISYALDVSCVDDTVDRERGDCLILAIRMPEASGLDLYGIVKTRGFRSPGDIDNWLPRRAPHGEGAPP